MANTLQVKRSAVASKVPLTTDLALGELAINTNDGILFLKKNDGADSIVSIKPITKANVEAVLTGTITTHSHDTASHTHGNLTNAGAIGSTASLPIITTTGGVLTTGTFGSSDGTFCQGNDSRLSDARTPTSHVHGNLTNAGAIGSTANLPVITTTSGVLTTGSFGTAANTFCQGNDARLSDARTPTAHNQAWSTITSTPTTIAGYGITDAASTTLTTYTTTTPVTEGWYRLATIPIGTTIKRAQFHCKAYTATGTVSFATVDVNVAYYSASTASSTATVSAFSSHSFDSRTNAENGWVFAYFRVSFDATSAYIDIYKYKTTTVTIETTPIQGTGWTWNTGALTVNPTVGSLDTQQCNTYSGYCANANRASFADGAGNATYASYGVYGGRTLANTTNKTGTWAFMGVAYFQYNSSYLSTKCFNLDLLFKEHVVNGLKSLDALEDFTLTLKATMPAHANTTEFNAAVPTLRLELAGRTALTGNDFACLVYSTSTATKAIRIYYKYKDANTHYSIEPQDRYGFDYSATYTNTTSSYFDYQSNQATVASLPAPAQGSVTYAVRKARIAKEDVEEVLTGAITSHSHATAAHTHGNLTDLGAIGSTSGLPIITGASGVLQAGSFGTTAGTFCQGNDSRLSDARTPTTHSHSEYLPTAGGTIAALSVQGTAPTISFVDTDNSNKTMYVFNNEGSIGFVDSVFGWGLRYEDATGDAHLKRNMHAVNLISSGYIEGKLQKSYDSTVTGDTSGAVTLDFATGNGKYHSIVGDTQFSISNATATSSMLVLLANGGDYTITWPSGIKWPKAMPPILSYTGGGLDAIVIVYAGDSNLYGFYATNCY